MPELILHAYDLSPFAEKVRLAFGHKRLAWRAVDVAVWPPRPDFDPLTAGYRRIPVLQIGADLYGDTALILRELDRRHPDPPLLATGPAAALAWWADTTLFLPAASLATSVIGDGIPPAFLEDRRALMRHDFSKAASLRDLAANRQRVAAQIATLADILADGRPFLLGDTLSTADLAAYHPLWFARKNGGPAVESMLPFAALDPWMARIAALGHGDRAPMTGPEALQVAHDADPAPAAGVAPDDPSGLPANTRVKVHSEPLAGAIEGTLVAATPHELVIAHQHERVGTVHLHLPRTGYHLDPA